MKMHFLKGKQNNLQQKYYKKPWKKWLPEELEGRVSSDGVTFGQLAFLGGVDLAQLDWRFLLSQDAGGLGVLGSEGLAMSAPENKLKESDLVSNVKVAIFYYSHKLPNKKTRTK